MHFDLEAVISLHYDIEWLRGDRCILGILIYEISKTFEGKRSYTHDTS